ncbi:MAG: succinylglutamate desuccinylase/aspartoacylase family protein [Verrucomicrobiales bacterium]|nr:succinylglutamate desuccinylase/aspartoacylase family protein [Verrucomicrobiales bacterium]
MKWFFVLSLCLFGTSFGAETSAQSSGLLAKGTDSETPWYRIESGVEGPTFLLVGGMHGNEPAGAIAAGQIRHWPIVKGTLIVIPRANHLALDVKQRRFPGLSDDAGDLNRHFPRTGAEEKTLSPLAAEIWDFSKAIEPDWVVDLHEGFAVNRQNPKSVGSTILCDATDETLPLFEHSLAAVNASVDAPENLFRLLSNSRTANGSLVRASMDRLGATGAIFETTYTDQTLGVRVRQHRLMMHRLLTNLGMIENKPDDLIFENPETKVTNIGIYVGPGVGGFGPASLQETFTNLPDEFTSRIIGPVEVQNNSITQFDVLIFPGGSGGKQAAGLGERGRKNVRDFVHDGGSYLGICAGCYLACENFPWSLKILDAKTKSSKWRRGKEVLELGFTDAGKRIMKTDRDAAPVKYQNGPVMEPAESPDIPDFETLAIFNTEVALNKTPEGIQKGSPAILAGHYGKGRVIGISPHPEQTEGLTHLAPELIRWATTPGTADSTGLSR